MGWRARGDQVAEVAVAEVEVTDLHRILEKSHPRERVK